MIKIAHRVNTIEALIATPKEFGVELDLRSEGYEIIIHHDPFQKGELFADYLKHFNHAFIILNIKTEGIEPKVKEMVESAGIADYFFLDISQPFLIKYALQGWKNLAVRVSEYETVESAMRLAGKAEWVWIDCFTGYYLSGEELKTLRENFKVCLVSPELQKHPNEWISSFIESMYPFKPDAVCTKFPDLWD